MSAGLLVTAWLSTRNQLYFSNIYLLAALWFATDFPRYTQSPPLDYPFPFWVPRAFTPCQTIHDHDYNETCNGAITCPCLMWLPLVGTAAVTTVVGHLSETRGMAPRPSSQPGLEGDGEKNDRKNPGVYETHRSHSPSLPADKRSFV